MLYTFSEFLSVLKEDIGIKDLPLPVSDTDFAKRIERSSLATFSQLHPRILQIELSAANALNDASESINGSVTYKVPDDCYAGTTILGIGSFYVGRAGGFNDFYMPNGSLTSPDMVLETVADIRLAAQLGSVMGRAPTVEFRKPNFITFYNGWYGATYRIEIFLAHDISLASIPDTAMEDFRELAEWDLKWYLFTHLNRKDHLDTGIGSIDLKIDQWQDAEDRYHSLVKDWRDNGANLDFETINWW